MAKIGVYIPEDRMADIERWRERLNFSRLFMEAFDAAISAEAALEKVTGKQMKELIARLKRQAEGDFERSWKLGAKEGREWSVKHAHLSHLRSIAEGRITFDLDQDVTAFLRHHYEHLGYAKTPEHEYEELQYDRFEDIETQTSGYNRGFVDAVMKVWEEIRPAFN